MTEVNEELAVKVWKADDDGKNATQKATLVGVSARTVSRLIVARMAFQKRLANREIANRTGWSLKRVTQVHQWWTAYAGTRSQTQELPQEPEAAPRISEAAGPHRATDPEFGPRGRGLFYFGQGLRDRLSLPSPVDVVKDMPTLPPLWQGESASEFRDSQSSEEASVAKEWGYGPVDATQLPSFTAFKKHLDGNPCWRELDALMEVYPRYCKSCQEAYQGLMVQYTGCSVAAGDEEARVMATAVLREVWHRVERGASLISPQVLAAKDDIVVALPWEVRMGAWASRGAAVCHVAPEAAAGGPIAALRDGDTVQVDLVNKTVNVKLSDAAIRNRLRRLPPWKPSTTSPWLRRYAHFVTSADTGAVLRVP